MPWQRSVGRQESEQQNAKGQQVAQASLNRSGVGVNAQEKKLSSRTLSSAGAAARKETGNYRGGADDFAVGLAHSERRRVRRPANSSSPRQSKPSTHFYKWKMDVHH